MINDSEKPSDEQKESGFFERNKIVASTIIIASMLFVGTFFLEKSKTIVELVPVFRGEVLLENGVVITTTKSGTPIIIKKDDPDVGQIRFSGEVRSAFNEIAYSLCNSNDIIVEIGAHFGNRTISFGNLVKNNGKVYAFEPNFAVFSYLKKSLFLNDLQDVVTVKNIAITDRSGTLNIEDCMSIVKNEDGTYKKPRVITVDCNKLDNEIDWRTEKVSLLSIDIPGEEFLIIKGSENIIDASPNIIIVASYDNDPPAKDAREVLSKLQKKGFRFYISKGGSDKLSFVDDLEKLLKRQEVILVITKRILRLE